MSSHICNHCSHVFFKKQPSQKFCSKPCANSYHTNDMRNKGLIKKASNLENYFINPRYCTQCLSIIPYQNRKGKFCSNSCSAQYNNLRRVHEPKVKPVKPVKQKSKNTGPKTWYKICPVTGETFTDINLYRNRTWSPWPNGKIRTIKLLASAFGIQLGHPDCTNQLDKAKTSIEESYVTEQLSSVGIHKKYDLSCSISHVPNFLKSLNIQRRSLSDAISLAYVEGRSLSDSRYITGSHMDWQDKIHTYRSSYELKYYRMLDEAKISYSSESLRIEYYDSIKQKARFAIPDILINQDLIIEVKSSWTYDRINMIDRFKSYKLNGYQFILALDFKEYIINHPEDLPPESG